MRRRGPAGAEIPVSLVPLADRACCCASTSSRVKRAVAVSVVIATAQSSKFGNATRLKARERGGAKASQRGQLALRQTPRLADVGHNRAEVNIVFNAVFAIHCRRLTP